MIHHTMIVSFENPIPDADLDQFLADIESVMRETGHAQTSASRRHIAVPAEQAFPHRPRPRSSSSASPTRRRSTPPSPRPASSS